MNRKTTQLASPASSGGLGNNFETRIQAIFAVLMLTGGFAPCLPPWPIGKIKLQGKYAGFNTDDLIVFVKHPNDGKEAKLLAQVKHFIRITEKDQTFGEVIRAAWHDFQNPEIFSIGTDAFALITAHLSIIDTNDVRTILEWARYTDNAEDFLENVNRTNFSSDTKRKKLQAFKIHLKNANKGKDVSDDDFWEFMKSFHLLGYDLDIKSGVTLSLLHSLIGQYSSDNAQALWSRIVDETQSANQNAGTITLETFSEDIKSAFQKQAVEIIPNMLIKKQEIIANKHSWLNVQYASELAVAVLLGSWDEKSNEDKAVIKQLASEDFTVWIKKIREILQQPKSPLILKNGIWSVAKRLEVWNALGSKLFDEHLDRFKKIAINVLKERNPMFDLPPNERYMASIYGKVLAHSRVLRKGMVESLALLGSYPNALSNCSLNKAESTADLTVQEILSEADWVLWASLNSLLPLLAEAAPQKFLDSVEAALQKDPCPFDELFAQEGVGITGDNYMTGLLWALETLAWDECHLTRVTVILGELAIHDPGGNWSNRPINSITTLFLPWLPQTIASVEKRLVAIKTLRKDIPEIAWKMLLKLLPNQHQTSMGSRKPVWRKTIPEDWSKGVMRQEYWEQVSSYADMAVEMAQEDLTKLVELIKYFDHLTQPAFKNLLDYLKSDVITSKSEEELLPLWTELVELVSKHSKFADTEWALHSNLVEKIFSIAERLAPNSPFNRYQLLFNRNDYDLYDGNGSWEEQRENLEQRRRIAIQNILEHGGVKEVIKFAESVELSWNVGLSFGFIAKKNIDSNIFPDLLVTEENKLAQLVCGFVAGRYREFGWEWVDRSNISNWTVKQIVQLLACLPFVRETWERSTKLLGKDENLYWKTVNADPFQDKDDLSFAIDKLVEYGRLNAAINCLCCMLHDKKPMDNRRTVTILLAVVSSVEAEHANPYNIVAIIKKLQDDPNTILDDLFQVEWAYLPLLNEYYGAYPKYLERRLASEPEFFCEMIRTVFRAKNVEQQNEPTEQQKNVAMQADQLLEKWKTPPGSQGNGLFDGDVFNNWLTAVKTSCEESGHLEVAFTKIGKVLIYTPPDPDGLWIHNSVAEALNAKDTEKMRKGFYNGIFNSRGVHLIDPTGKPEKELAAKDKQQAEEVEAHGYYRLSLTLRNMADSYRQEAERIIEKHKVRGDHE